MKRRTRERSRSRKASGTNPGAQPRASEGQGRAVATPKSETLRRTLKRGQTPDEGTADLIVAGLGANAVAAMNYSRSIYGQNIDLTALLNSLVTSAEHVNAGNLGEAEAILSAQAATLNAMFTNLVLRSMSAQYVESAERFMRFGLKAQAQCRATLETLAAIKNPPTVFARQANIANGPQQVNNTAQLPEASRVRAISEKLPTELLEAHVERVDAGTTEAAVGGDQAVEAVGVVNRSKKRGRQTT